MEPMDNERGPGEITGNQSRWMELNNPGDGGSSEEKKEKIEEPLPLGGKDTERRSPGAAWCSDSSDEAGGDEADGDEVSGDEAGGDESSVDEVGGDEASGDGAGRDEAGGDEVSVDEAIGDEAIGDEAGGNEATGDGAIGDEAGGDEASGNEATGDGAIGDEASGDEAGGNEATGDGAIGDEASGNEATGDGAGRDQAGGDEVSGDEAIGDEAGGDEASGNEATGDGAIGDEAGGDEASGNEVTGDGAIGDEASGDEAGWDEVGGDEVSGDEAGGDEANGNEAGRDEAGGDEIGGDEASGLVAGGDEAGGDDASWDEAGWDEAGGDEASGLVAGGDEAGGDEASPVPLLASDDSEAGSHDGLRSVKASTDVNSQGTEPPSEHGSGMDLSETSSEDGEDDGDHDDVNSEVSEEDEEHPEELYCQPAYPTQVFQALEEMKQSSFLTDLLLRTASGFSVRAHSLVLAAVSSLVRKMLQERDGEMVLRLGAEVSALGLSAVLEFAYTGTITGLDGGSLAQIRMAAHSLGVPRVLELCRKEEEMERKTDDGQEGKVEEVPEDQLKLSLESIRQLWEDRVGCDVELEAEGRIFRVHKVLLAASSDYFRAMFGSGMRESQQASVTLFLMGAAELGILLECSYSGTLVLDWDVVFELTCTALRFQFQPALSLCLGFMQQDMDAHSCLDVAAFAEAYGMSDLRDAAEDFVLRRFEEVSATPKFQDLPVEKLKTYLRSSSLCVKSELPVFKAVVSWIGANPRRRVREARELLATVHFPLMTFKEFKEVKAITSWPKVRSEDLYDSLLEEFCSGTSDVHSDFRTYLPKDALVLVGGERITDDFDKRVPCRDIWFSNSLRNHVGVMKRVEWRRLGDLPEKPRFSHSVGVIGGQLYVVGGRHYYGRADTMRSTYRYDPVHSSWQELADMQEERSSFALVVLDERMYAIGGHHDSEANTESVEVYCTKTDCWRYVHPLDQPLSGHAASLWDGKIFISGGFDCRYQCLVSMLQYHPGEGTTYLEDMSQSRAQHCMETFQDRLYVAGGVSDTAGQVVDQLACEFYDPVRDSWTSISPLSVPHVGAASAVLEGKIYVIGGYCHEDYSDTKRVHRYDPAVQCWEGMCGTPGPTTYIAACVLPIPAHLRQLQ